MSRRTRRDATGMNAFAGAVYRSLLRLLPRSLRHEFGDDMAQLFDDRMRATPGIWGRIKVAVSAQVDLIVQALGERRSVRLATREREMRFAAAPRRAAVGTMSSDFRASLRKLARRPAFAVLVVAIIALGIGLNTALLSVVKAVLIEPMPFADAERLVVLTGTYEGAPFWSLGVPELRDLESRSAAFDRIGVFSTGHRKTRTGNGETEALAASYASSSFFDLLGIGPLLGRTFTVAEDDGPGDHPVVVLGHDYWQRALGGDSAVIGTALELDGAPFTVVGVMPDRFRFSPADVWLPLSMGSPAFGEGFYESRRGRFHFGIARVDDTRALDTARAEVDAIMEGLLIEHPEDQRARGARIHRLRSFFFGSLEQPVRVLFAGAVLVLLICAVNVGALMLARAMASRKELAIRHALGATRGRLMLGFLSESFVMSMIGGGLGALLATWAVDFMMAILPLGLPAFATVSVDRSVLAMAIGLILITGLGVGLAPALAAGPDHRALGSGRGQGPGRRAVRGRGVLVAAEVALALMLLIGAGLTARSTQRLLQADLGFDTAGLLAVDLDLGGPGFRADDPATEAASQGRFIDTALDQIRAVPGVEGVTAWGLAPLGWSNRHLLITPASRPLSRDAENRLFAQHLKVGAGGLGLLGIPIVSGRDLADSDRLGTSPVVVVDESIRDAHYARGAVGETIHLWLDDQPVAHTIVGVARNARHRGARNDESTDGVVGDVYRSILAAPSSYVSMLVRVTPGVAVGTLMPSIRRTLAGIESRVPIIGANRVERSIGSAARVPRIAATLLTVYATIAVTFAYVGIYALLAYTVRLKRTELAIRSALGARRGKLLALVFGQGMRPVLVGIAGGMFGAFALSRWLQSLLFEIEHTDRGTYATVAVMTLAVAALACFLPARQAAKRNPATALRND